MSNVLFAGFYDESVSKAILKDKSGVVIIVDYSRDYIVVNGVYYFFNFFLFKSPKLHISIC